MKVFSLTDRLSVKNVLSLFVSHLRTQYNLSIAAARTITEDLFILKTLLNNQAREDGQIIRYVVSKDEPAGKGLKDCEYIPVRLTISHPDDLKIRKEHGLNYLISCIIKRICQEAYAQQGVLSQEDIADILHLSRSTIHRYLKGLGKDEFVPTRATVTDSGRGTTHKWQIITLYLLGYTETEISERTHHDLRNVERYISDFSRIVGMLLEECNLSTIIHSTKLSKRLVEEHVELYHRLKGDSLYQEPLTRFEKRIGLILSSQGKRGCLIG